MSLHGGKRAGSGPKTSPGPYGEATDVICIKGSGADMADNGPAGLPAVRLERLRKLRALLSARARALTHVGLHGVT